MIYSAELKTSRAGFVRQIGLVVKELGRTQGMKNWVRHQSSAVSLSITLLQMT